jgi:hypothetical protein
MRLTPDAEQLVRWFGSPWACDAKAQLVDRLINDFD